ncbi:DoxX family protein [freshwater metagenome]|uniref:DoxX family protein n=1 Tax=freshwater metagenome TaxID=449393 RepID=A0A094PX62_9ZZZZ
MKKAQPWIGLLARLGLGGVLLYAGYLKVFTPEKSMMAVRAYELLPIWMANIFGLVLPWLEVGAGVLLIIGVGIRYAAIFGSVLMIAFIIAIAQAWARGLSIDCGCFGDGGVIDPSETKYLETILRDIGFALLGFYLIRYPVTRFALEKTKNKTSTPLQGE